MGFIADSSALHVSIMILVRLMIWSDGSPRAGVECEGDLDSRLRFSAGVV